MIATSRKKNSIKKPAEAAAGESARPRGSDTHRRLRKTTAKIIARDGILGLRYSQIAKMAKVPQALLAYHFPSLESLLLELVQFELDKLRKLSVDRIDDNLNHPKGALEGYIRTPFELAEVDSEFRAIWSGFYHLCAMNPVFSELNSNVRKTGRERVISLITMVLATDGSLLQGNRFDRRSLDELGIAVHALITGYCVMAMSESRADYRVFADRAVRASFAAIGLE